jgi:hypothetical protein
MVGEEMKKIASIVLVCLIMTAPVTIVYGLWESPGNGSSYTLSWLESNTNAVTSSGQDIYHLVDDIKIANHDTLTIYAGETLYFDDETYSIDIDGDFFVNGGEYNPAYLRSSDGKSQFTNIKWNYKGNNELLMLNVTIDNLTCVIEDSEDEDLIMESAAYPAPDDPLDYGQPWNSLPEEVLFQIWIGHTQIENIIDRQLIKVGMDPSYPPWDTDWDEDGIPNWFENQFDFLDPHDDEDYGEDDDGDGLTNGMEYTLGTNPDNSDTDGDDLPDKWESINVGYDPLDSNSDNDTLRDDVDNQPQVKNPKKAFLFEATDFVTYDNLTPLYYEIANDLDDRDWDVWLFSDEDYSDTQNYTLNDDVADNFVHYEVDRPSGKYGCTWINFISALALFKGEAQPGANDIVMIMIGSHGDDTIEYEDEDWFGIGFTKDATEDDGGLEEDSGYVNKLEPELDEFTFRVDFVWIDTCYSGSWKDDLVDDDDLGTDDAVFITSFPGKEIVNRLTAWDALVSGLDADHHDGVYKVFIDMTSTQRDNRKPWDSYDEGPWNRLFLW